MEEFSYVGLDVHKESIQVAMLEGPSGEPLEWQVRNDAAGLRQLAKKLVKRATGDVLCCYEAGPCGYGVQRELRKVGIECKVIAPSLIPAKPGDRIKTDRRDARKLARFLRAGELTEVHAPTAEQEAVRDLCRAREDAKEDLLRCRHRLSKMLLLHGRRYDAGKHAWTLAHRQWLRSLRFEDVNAQKVFDDRLLAIEHVEQRLQTLCERIEEVATKEPYAEVVGYLRCFRGIDTTTAMTIVAELHGILRFETPRKLMAYLGLVPSEHSSAGTRRQGSITKTGNSHVRRVLVEAAWHYRHRPNIGPGLKTRGLQSRRRGQPGWVISIADKAQQRLHRRYWRIVERGRNPNIATVAVARELVGYLWDVMRRLEIASMTRA
jgi:transposase